MIRRALQALGIGRRPAAPDLDPALASSAALTVLVRHLFGSLETLDAMLESVHGGRLHEVGNFAEGRRFLVDPAAARRVLEQHAHRRQVRDGLSKDKADAEMIELLQSAAELAKAAAEIADRLGFLHDLNSHGRPR